MEPDFFLLASAAGFLATYVHMAFSLTADRLGPARLDYAGGLAGLFFGEAFEGRPPYWLGLAAVHLNGIFLALLYGALIGRHLPGPPLVRGLIWGGRPLHRLAVFLQPLRHPARLLQPQAPPARLADRPSRPRDLRRRPGLALPHPLREPPAAGAGRFR